MLIRVAIVLASIMINASGIPAAAAQCALPNEIAATRTRWAAERSRIADASNHEAACRAYATSFYESVTTRQAAADCTRNADRDRDIAVLDSEVDSFNNLLASHCGG